MIGAFFFGVATTLWVGGTVALGVTHAAGKWFWFAGTLVGALWVAAGLKCFEEDAK